MPSFLASYVAVELGGHGAAAARERGGRAEPQGDKKRRRTEHAVTEAQCELRLRGSGVAGAQGYVRAMHSLRCAR